MKSDNSNKIKPPGLYTYMARMAIRYRFSGSNLTDNSSVRCEDITQPCHFERELFVRHKHDCLRLGPIQTDEQKQRTDLVVDKQPRLLTVPWFLPCLSERAGGRVQMRLLATGPRCFGGGLAVGLINPVTLQIIIEPQAGQHDKKSVLVKKNGTQSCRSSEEHGPPVARTSGKKLHRCVGR